MSRLRIVDDIQIASPCPVRWQDMKGDESVRLCGSCDKNVYNLYSLSAEEVADLIERMEGKLCVRLYRRADGKVLTADCPLGLRDRLRLARKGRFGTALLFALASAMLASALFFAPRTLNRIDQALIESSQNRPIKGDVVVTPGKVVSPPVEVLGGGMRATDDLPREVRGKILARQERKSE